MSDVDTRQLERTAAAGGYLRPDMERLKASWARTLEWRECHERRLDGSVCATHVPVLVWDRHHQRHVSARNLERGVAVATRQPLDDQPDDRSAAEPRRTGMRVIPLPAVGAIGMRPRKSPLWHRLIVQPGQEQVRFFHDAGGQISFLYGKHRGSLPHNSTFFAYGVSLMIDADADTASALNVYTEGVVQFGFHSSVLADWPARLVASDSGRLRTFLADEVMLDPTSGNEVELDRLAPARSLTIFGRPLELVALEAWSLDLLMPKPVTQPTGIVGVVHGIGLRGLTS